MRIGITYDLKADLPPSADLPDDIQEEFDSLTTVEAIASVLRGLGHRVDLLGDGRRLLERLLHDAPDFVFNLAEGEGVGRCREARVPAVLEMLGIPYSGSDPLTLGVTLDKDCAKRLVGSSELQTVPWGRVILPEEDGRDETHWLPFPAIVKPAWEGSSKGIRSACVVDRVEDLPAVVAALQRAYSQPMLVEQYIEGRELTVGVLGNGRPQVLGVMEVLPRETGGRFIYSLDVKRDWRRQVRYEHPPRLKPPVLAQVERAALEAYGKLGCRDVARIDYRLAPDGLYFLEANPLPGLNPESSDLVILADLAGWTYGRLIEAILRVALDRVGLPAANVPTTATA
jgi:D-alanine-D-alanine ligase